MKITDAEMKRRQLMAKAGSYLLDAMAKFTEENQGLTGCEWLKAINDTLVARCLAEELREQWGSSNE